MVQRTSRLSWSSCGQTWAVRAYEGSGEGNEELVQRRVGIGCEVCRADDAYSTLYAMLIDSESDAMKMVVMACVKRVDLGYKGVVEVECLPLSFLIHFSAEKMGGLKADHAHHLAIMPEAFPWEECASPSDRPPQGSSVACQDLVGLPHFGEQWVVQREMVEAGHLERSRHRIPPRSIPRSAYPGSGSGFDSWKEVGVVAEVVDCLQSVKALEPICFPSSSVPSSSLSPVIVSSLLPASWHVCP